ncbi:cysteine rich repeat-containing protein [Xanthobacter sp. DSM 24535]|uniref:cysteine rich repeat-containing protein n=1 Tax=Roseixanthobacter psychrophilus TaxID=3119917 RepID=UPI003729420D
MPHLPKRALLRLARFALPLLVLGPPPALAQSAAPPAVQAAQQACRTDAQKLCASVQPGGGRIVQCLREQQGQLSEACRTALASLPSQQGQ